MSLFWGFLVKVNYHSVPIIVTDQLKIFELRYCIYETLSTKQFQESFNLYMS